MTRKFSADDSDLNTASIITGRNRKYSDINLLFQPRPGNGDVYISRDAAAVKQAIRTLLLTNPNEVPFKPTVGAGVRNFLFDLNTNFTHFEIEKAIRRTIADHEPRASVNSVRVRGETNHAVNITVEFTVINTVELITLNLIVERLR